MKSKRKWPVIAGILFIAVFLAALAFTTSGNARYRCEVCVTFGGRTLCRNGAATTQPEAERIARDEACSELSSGMTSLMQCQQSGDTKVTWKH
jgi:hypothetical protein